MNRISLLLLIIISIIFGASKGLAVEQQTKLVFKDSTIKTGTFKSLNPWAVTFKDGKFYAIKLMSRIITSEHSVVDQLKSYYPDLRYSKSDETYTIQVTDLKLLPLGAYNRPFVNRYFIVLNGLSARAENLEFQINMISNLNPKIVARLAVATGLNFENGAENLNTISLGVGGIKSYHKFTFLATLNLAEKTRMPDDISKLVPFFSMSAQTSLLPRMLFTVGGRYYFRNLRINNQEAGFSASMGIGYNF